MHLIFMINFNTTFDVVCKGSKKSIGSGRVVVKKDWKIKNNRKII